MSKSLYLFFTLCLLSLSMISQNQQKTIVDEINTPKAGQGNIKVMQDDVVQSLMLPRQQTTSTDSTKTTVTSNSSSSSNSSNSNVYANAAKSNVKTRGYKIQVFMGNNQQQSKREAEFKQAQIRSIFPEHETEISFKSPFFRLRAGNFLSREEAQQAMKEMKRAFPSFGQEMIIVSDMVKR